MEISLGILETMAIAAVLYWIGNWLVGKISLLRRYCIPPPLVGGLLFAAVNTWLHVTGRADVSFHSGIQSFFMIVFFTTVGFTVRVPLLKQGGKAVIRCLVLASILTLIQNVLGAGVLYGMGVDPRLGLAVGSISLVGGPGTAAAFGPVLEQAGAVGGSVVGISAATFGLVMGSVMGGPIAERLIQRYGLAGEVNEVPAFQTEQGEGRRTTWAHICRIVILTAFCMATGVLLARTFTDWTGITLPDYIGSMILAACVRNTTRMTDEEFPDQEGEVIGNLTLCAFLTMAMMSLRIWELAELAGPLVVALALQTVVLFLFSWFLVFPKLGRNYEAAVMTAGFIGFSMGATSNAMANMQAVTKRHGPSSTAFFVIPTVGGMFIDFVNVFVITAMIPMLGSLI